MPDSSPVRLSITGMRCAGCVSSVEKALRGVEGVQKADVNFADHSATISGSASVEQLVAAVTTAGFAAEEIVDEEAREASERLEEQERTSSLLFKSRFALVIAIPALALGFPAMLGGEMPHWLMQWGSPLMAVATLAVMLVSGPQFFVGAWKICAIEQLPWIRWSRWACPLHGHTL